MQSGGKEYTYIPCLNSDPQHISVLAQLAEEELSGWLESRLN